MKFNIVGVFIILLMASCSTQRMICPAYQSAFIHDQGTLDRHFSYFQEDSTPKILEASKDKHLLIDPLTYRKRLRALRTVPMVDVYPIEDDSVVFNDDLEAELMLAAEETKSGDLYNEADLLKQMPEEEAVEEDPIATEDSVYVISLKKEKFNIDQELYLWYLREYLVYPDVKLQQQENAEFQAEEAKDEKQGFFKRLFGGKKDKAQAEIDSPVVDGEEAAEPEKKGVFSFLKKGDKPPKEKKEKVKKQKKAKKEKNSDTETEPVEVEEEDDGEEDF